MAIPAIVWQLLTPVISAAVTAGIKEIAAQYGNVIPSWAKPIIAAVAGSVVGVVTGDPSTLGVDAALGAALGGGGPMVRESYAEIKAKLSPAGIE